MNAVTRAVRGAARWLANRRPVRVRGGLGDGLRLDVRRGSATYRDGTNELAVQRALVDAVLASGATPVFLDVGANIGFFSLVVAKNVVRARVYALEPVRANAEAAASNARRNGLRAIQVLAVAAGSSDGEVELVLAAHPGGAVLAEVGRPPDEAGVVRVPMTKVDSLVARGEIPVPDVVKIDVEGAELQVLRGMEETLRGRGPRVVCEVDDEVEEVAEGKAREVESLLTSYGYATRRLERSYAGANRVWNVIHVAGKKG